MPDATLALQAWLDSVHNHVLARLDGSCYRVDGQLVLGAKTGVTLDGNGSKFQTYTISSQAVEHLLVGGDVDTTVKNLSIDGGKTVPGYDARYAFQHGITITGGCDRVVLDNVTIDHVWGDYVAITPHSRNRDHVRVVPQNITIENSHLGLDRNGMGSGRMGISIQQGAHIYIHDNVIRSSSRSAIDIEPVSSGATLVDIHFEHNTFGPHGLNLLANHNYGHANPVIDGVYFRDNTLTGTPLQIDSVADITNINSHDPSTFRRHHYEIVNNVSDTGIGNGSCTDPEPRSLETLGHRRHRHRPQRATRPSRPVHDARHLRPRRQHDRDLQHGSRTPPRPPATTRASKTPNGATSSATRHTRTTDSRSNGASTRRLISIQRPEDDG